MKAFFSHEIWVGKQKEVVRDFKGRFMTHKTLKPIKKFKKYKKEIDVIKEKKKIQVTEKYLIYESDKKLNLRGQIITRWVFKKGRLKHSTLGASYLSNNVKRDLNKLIDQSRINAFAKSYIIGSPDYEKMIEISYKYIIRKDKL